MRDVKKMTTIAVSEGHGVPANTEKDNDLEKLIFESLGEASSCWSNLAGAGEFQSERAVKIGEKLLDAVREYVR